VVTAIAGEGTAEPAWLAWPALHGWPELDRSDMDDPVVVAAHPDDEVLGAGGLLALARRIELVAVTDGEASHPESTVYTRAGLAAVRRAETGAALRRLGLEGVPVHRLGHPDGGVDEEALGAYLTRLLVPGRWCLSTWRGDGHPDHEAVGRAAATACAATGARLVEYPIWLWHWARPGDARVPWDRARVVPLPDRVRAAKAAAVAEFASQIRPLGPDPADAAILPPAVLARFQRPMEVYFA